MNRAEKRAKEKLYNSIMSKEQTKSLINKRYREDIEKQAQEKWEKIYQEQFKRAIEIYNLVLVYSLHFSELTRFGGKRINSFMDDFTATVDEFNNKTKGFTVEEYMQQLKDEHIIYNIKTKE